MPGCLGLDALWQLTGFFLGWMGAPGRGRALGVGEVKFKGMVTPDVKKVEYVVDVQRVILRKLNMAIANGVMKADGELSTPRRTCVSGLLWMKNRLSPV